ncbi:uncharacterized protein LOC133778510 isoform X2 [Humulus lupulus]|uniref:uncharacterized protein LOC133778510 isoform X2 n=1 Tax=Humulus lupulus TaxID=3486 RepID=UPI002B414DDC|nr:uncharacterized protein LOC133778510 isoform X2 [Humulus lupulus]
MDVFRMTRITNIQVKDFLYPELRKQDNQLFSNQGESLSEVLQDRSKNGLLLTPKAEGVQSERKAGKVSRSSSNFCAKRPRVVKLQDPPLVGVEGIKDMSHKLTSCSLKGTCSDKTQLVKQKSNLNSKRGDKRSLRVPLKTKFDSFSMKAGLTSFGSASGGNNFFGVYGLKSDNHDVTNLVDDLPLNELLHGSYQPPSLGKDKGKKATVVNESFLHSLRKSCSLLQLPRPVSQNIVEIDSCSNKKMSAWLLNSVSVEASGVNSDTGDSSLIDVLSSNKDTCIKSEAPDNPPELLLHQPKEILQRLALPPPKDLESLLLDAAKPTLSSKNTADLRSGKQMSRRVSLPPFQWSHTSSGHCRTSSDVVKLSTSKGTCQGRWLKIGKEIKSSFGIVTSKFTDLESLTYDQSLVPSGLKVACVDNVTSPQEPTSLTGRGCDSEATCLKESGGKVNNPGNAGHSPRLYAAARTLYDIATGSPRQSLDRIISWPKKSSQKTMKARKLKYNGKTEESQLPLASVFRPENLARIEEIVPFSSKKPKLSNINHKRDPNHVKKETLKWSTPRSSRSSPSRTGKDIIAGYPRHTTNILKQSSMMPPPAPPVVRVSDIATNSQQKLRKLPLEWNRGRDRDRDRVE